MKYSKNYSNLGFLIGYYNDKLNNINIKNYGSEASLLNYFNSNITYNQLKEYLDIINQYTEYKQYNRNDYFKKIGLDLAAILFIFFKDSSEKLDIYKEIISKFTEYYKNEVENLKTEEIKKEIEDNYQKLIEEDKTLKNTIDTIDDFEKYENQYKYNLYKYPKKILDGYHTIFYLKNVILRF